VSLVSNSCRRIDWSKSVSSLDSFRVVEDSYPSSQLSGGLALDAAIIFLEVGAIDVGDCVVGGEGGLMRLSGSFGGRLAVGGSNCFGLREVMGGLEGGAWLYLMCWFCRYWWWVCPQR